MPLLPPPALMPLLSSLLASGLGQFQPNQVPSTSTSQRVHTHLEKPQGLSMAPDPQSWVAILGCRPVPPVQSGRLSIPPSMEAIGPSVQATVQCTSYPANWKQGLTSRSWHVCIPCPRSVPLGLAPCPVAHVLVFKHCLPPLLRTKVHRRASGTLLPYPTSLGG